LTSDFRDRVQLTLRFVQQGIRLNAAFFEYRANDPLALRSERDEEVQRAYGLIAVLASESLGLLDGLLRLLGEFVKPEWHLFLSSSFVSNLLSADHGRFQSETTGRDK
jgi:hypothetical protein